MDVSEEKLGLGIGCIVMMVGTWVTTHWFPGLATSLTTVVGGITGIYALYVGAHVTNKWVDNKTGSDTEQDLDPTVFPEPHPDSNGK